jgi:hypothetical protein
MKGPSSMAKLSLVGSDRNPARAALAEAIAHRNELAASVAALNAAQRAVQDRLSDARIAASNLADALKTAKAATALHLVNVSVGRVGDAPPSVASVRRSIEAAEDDLEVARAAELTLKGRLAEQQMRLGFAQDGVRQAAQAVLRQSPRIAAIVSEVAELQRRLIEQGAALDWLYDNGLIPPNNISEGADRRTPSVAETIARLGIKPRLWPEWISASSMPGAAAWEAALAALMTDADAPLPA